MMLLFAMCDYASNDETAQSYGKDSTQSGKIKRIENVRESMQLS